MTMRTKIVRNAGLAAAGTILTIAICPQRSYAQSGAYAVQYYAEDIQDDGFTTIVQDGSEGATNASVNVYGAFVNAGLVPFGTTGKEAMTANVQASSDSQLVGGFIDTGYVWETVTTGAVGGTLTLGTSLPVVTFGPVLDNDYIYEAGIQLHVSTSAIDYSTGGFASDIAFAAEDEDYNTSTPDGYVYYSFESSPSGNTTTNTWVGNLSTTFDVAPNTNYEVEMDLSAAVYTDATGLTVGTALLDPTMTLNASPGVTYTSTYFLPQGVTAPEPSSCALLLPVGGMLWAAGCRVRARRRRSEA
jgi:hypothetical protein